MTIRHPAVLWGSLSLATCLTALAAPARAETPCFVLGDSSAKVSAVEGVRSPVFETAACVKLRLVSGHALASWVGADGKPQLVPITASGVARVPQAGSEERSVRVALSELSSTRADQRAAYMRGSSTHAVAVYVPRDGIEVPGSAGAAVRVRIEEQGAGGAAQPQTLTASADHPLRLDRGLLHPGVRYSIDIDGAGSKTSLVWRIVDAGRQAEIDARLDEVSQQVADPAQRDIVTAMLYDQLKLATNLSQLAPRLHASRAGAGAG